MEETEPDVRMTGDAAPEQTDEARGPEAVVATARLLANPRRIRRT